MARFDNNLKEIFDQYEFNISQYVGYRVISRGHINTTYILYFDRGNVVKRYLLQEINTQVFTNPQILMSNIHNVTKYGRRILKIFDVPNSKDKMLRIFPSKDNLPFITLSNGQCWRVYHYVENSITYDTSSNPKVFFEAGKVIGEFQRLMTNFPLNALTPTILNFHNTPVRYQTFEKMLFKAPKEVISTCEEEISFFQEHKDIATSIQSLMDDGTMPIRVTHNDTKLNNVMFEYGDDIGLCLVDLDTIMPGTVCFDFGDFVRSACNKGEEDAKDLSTVIFQKELCVEFARGLLEKLGTTIQEVEVKNLLQGAIVMTYECGMRFLSDYLDGNHYFKTEYPEHNLIRCRTQIHMCKQLLENKEELDTAILKMYQNNLED